MRHFIPWLIANTRSLLSQAGVGGKASAGFHEMLGTMAPFETGGSSAPLRQVRLKKPDEAPIVDVPWTGSGSDSWNRQENHELVKATFSTPPVFYVLDERGQGSDKELKVTGADFNTYATIRYLRTTHVEMGTYGNELNHAFKRADRNQHAYAWIDAVLTEPVSDAAPAAPVVPTNTAAPPPPSALGAADSGTSGTVVRTPPVLGPDVWAPKVKLPMGIGPKVFGPLPNDPNADEQKRSVMPGIGGSF